MSKFDSVTTSGNFFEVEDISHKPKRTQRGNLLGKTVHQIPEEEVESIAEARGIPKTCTLENLISFYETNARGEVTRLYKTTALFLRKLLDRSKPKSSEEDE